MSDVLETSYPLRVMLAFCFVPQRREMAALARGASGALSSTGWVDDGFKDGPGSTGARMPSLDEEEDQTLEGVSLARRPVSGWI